MLPKGLLKRGLLLTTFAINVASPLALAHPSRGQAHGHQGDSLPQESVSQEGVKPEDFPAPLDQASIRSTAQDLDEATFALKWQQASKSPLKLLRSFPGAFHQDLKQIVAMPGSEILCFGDAHIENFGFVRVDGNSVFAFNDLDDSGYCRVAVDAARYFTSVRLFNSDQQLLDRLVQRYTSVLTDTSNAVTVPDAFWPDWTKVASKELEKESGGSQFNSYADLAPVSDSESRAILQAVQSDVRLSRLRVLDVVSAGKADGGSGGYARYRLLVEDNGTQQIIEFKEATIPGVNFGTASQVLSFDQRLPLLKQDFWGADSAEDYYYVMVGVKRFLVRNRLNLHSLDIEKVDGSDMEAILMAQVSYMALLHKAAWGATPVADVGAWLTGTSATLADRWTRLAPK